MYAAQASDSTLHGAGYCTPSGVTTRHETQSYRPDVRGVACGARGCACEPLRISSIMHQASRLRPEPPPVRLSVTASLSYQLTSHANGRPTGSRRLTRGASALPRARRRRRDGRHAADARASANCLTPVGQTSLRTVSGSHAPSLRLCLTPRAPKSRSNLPVPPHARASASLHTRASPSASRPTLPPHARPFLLTLEPPLHSTLY